jgi:L-asparaginase II
VSAAVVDASGRLVARAGDPDLSTFLRSAAKPFQALPLLEDGAADRFRVSQQEIALACASHNSEPAQVDLVRAFLSRLDLAESDLACGPHRPLSADMALTDADGARPPESPAPASPLWSNCSGKHTAMLALARHHGWPIRGYQEAGHPVQRRCKDTMARWTRLEAGAIGEAVDGCGVVTFALPVRALGLAYARLGSSTEPAAKTIVRAMSLHPDLVAGTGRPCTALMQAYPGQVLAKVGAEGVYAAALLGRGLGVGLKVEDGHNWAAVVALWAVLGALDLEPIPAHTLPRFAEIPVRNTRGETVGSLRAAGALSFV